ncbi:uncharacterized protein LOC129576049 [Sitodiplosis mosellana]|uniref:uncharacterized protein LOC129576049 n=1 Tax=Sitodiplosis mosellana TaxID=263140 RepID=UPI002443FE33|nr:uncharacterized protein LOC129576049 [Sitodiplosis mosellana]
MSIPQILLTAAGSAPTPVISPNSRRLQPPDPMATAKENIRERLNMHVKKRIQQEIYPISPPTSTHHYPDHYLDRGVASSLKPTYPFLMSGASSQVSPVVVFANSCISVASDYTQNSGRTIPIPQIERQSSKSKQQPKKVTKKKKAGGNKKKTKQVDANQYAENLMMNTKFSDDSNDFHDRNDSSMNGCPSPQTNGDSPPIPSDKNDQKLANTPDILSMVLSLKKNALMHDPYVIQFLSAIR